MASKNGVTIIVAGEDKTGEVFAAVNKHLQQTREEGKKTAESFASVGDVLQKGLAFAGVTFGLQQVLSTMKGMVQSSIDLGMEIGHMAEQTGISTQNLSALKYMSDQTGVSFETLSKGFKKLSTDIFDWEHGAKAAGVAFTALNISQKELEAQGGDLYKVLELVADRFAGMKDGAEKNAIASKLFGRAGQDLIPILNQGAGAIEKYRGEAQSLGLVLDEQGIKKLQALHAEMSRVEGEVRGGSLAFTDALAPALEGIAKYFTQVTQGTDLWTAAGRQAGLVAVEIATAFQWLADFVRETKDEYVNLTNAINAFDYNVGSKFNWTQKYRDEEKARRDAALKAEHDSKADHDAMLAEEKQFVDAMKGIEAGLLHPSNVPARPDVVAGAGGSGSGSTGGDGSGGGGRGAGRDHNIMTINTIELANKNIEELTQAVEENTKSNVKPTLGPSDDTITQPQTTSAPSPMLSTIPMQNMPLSSEAGPLSWLQKNATEIEGEGEKIAHAVFDPLFNFDESWNKKWKQTVKNLTADLGQYAEGQLFGALFGDPNGRGGKGWMGGSFKGDTSRPGVAGAGLLGDLLASLTHKGGVSPVSNGAGASGAGTMPTAAASLAQIGKSVVGAGASGGIQVVLNNNGAPLEVSDTQQSQSDGGESQWLQIGLKQLSTNGPFAAALMSVIPH
jgi:DNA-binding Xre family transcriptional regulator